MSYSDKGEVILSCLSLKGKPEPKIEWLRDDGTDIDDSQLSRNEFGLELRLNGTKENNNGVYKCVGKNELEEKLAFIKIKESKSNFLKLICENFFFHLKNIFTAQN